MALNFPSFEQTDEWAAIINHLRKVKEDLTGELIIAAEKGETSKVQFLAGKVAMIDEILSVPEWLYSTDRVYKGKNGGDTRAAD